MQVTLKPITARGIKRINRIATTISTLRPSFKAIVDLHARTRYEISPVWIQHEKPRTMGSFLDTARAKCPHCGKEDFASLSEPQPDDILGSNLTCLLTCLACDRRVTLEDALAAGIKEALVKEFAKDGSFKR
jgi:hypothetical protein